MKSACRLLAVGFVACGLLVSACVSGDTVGGGGGRSGSGSGGHATSGGQGGFIGGGQGGFIGSGQGGFIGSGQGGFVGGGQGGSIGGGQGGFVGGGTGGSLAAGPCTVPATSPLIDNLEKAANGTAQGCVHGYWYTYNDGSAGTQTPPANMFMNSPITDRAGSTFAAHSTGSGFTGDTATPKNLFAGFGLDFNAAPAPSTTKYTVNASVFKGVTFFAKGSGTINVNIPTSKTDPTLGCVSTTASPCYDISFKAITLTAAWAPYTLMWTDFGQIGFGAKEVLDGSNIGGIKFESKATAPATFPPYDAWIDDLKFVP
jgi:hypothetical protein